MRRVECMLETKYAKCEFDDAIYENAQPLASNFDGVLQDAMMVCCRILHFVVAQLKMSETN